MLQSTKMKKSKRQLDPSIEVGGWVNISLGWKKLENRPNIKFCVYTFHASMPVCILFECTLLNVVNLSHYDSSVLSMSGMGLNLCCSPPYHISMSVAVSKLQVAIIARSSREMSQTVRIDRKHIMSRIRVSVRPSNFLYAENT